jgi:hypothetical protein
MIFGYSTGHLLLDLIAIVGALLIAGVIGSPIVLLWPATGSAYANSRTLIRPVSHAAPASTRAAAKPASELERIRAEAADTGELEAIA